MTDKKGKQVKPAVEVKDLSYTYPGNEKKTLKKLNFTIQPGEIFGFLGPSGAGKSTTQKIITGILKEFQGEVKVIGEKIETITNDFYENIGVSFETPNLYERFSGRENLEHFASLYTKETENVDKLLEMVGLKEAADVKVSNYSKGMKMRLNLCRAFLNQPKLLFLDEPTSGLDPANARRVKDIIRNYCQEGKTVFLTTHDMKAVDDLCHRVAFLVAGEIVLIDSPQRLKKDYGSPQVEVVYFNGDITEKTTFPLQELGAKKKFCQLIENYQLESIHSQEADLEEVFIEVTGRRLR